MAYFQERARPKVRKQEFDMQLFVVSLRSTWSGHQPLSYIVVRRTPTERLVVDLELLPREEFELVIAINGYVEKNAKPTWLQNN